MTMRVIDVAPNEALLATLADRLERSSSGEEGLADEEIQRILDHLDPTFVDTAKSMLREFIERTDHLKRTKA
jgi:hypothetical protein